jgi:UDP-glucose 4-epimerase
MKETVLITGGLGYVGGRIAKHLSQSPEYFLRLTAIDDNPVIPGWLAQGQVMSMDILSGKDICKVCQDVDTIVHLAAVNEIDSARDPELALEVNGTGTVRLLRAAEKVGVKRFVYFSTAHVYGVPLTGTIDEGSLARPVHPYAITHRTAEDFVLAAHDSGKLIGIVFRLSNGFGAPIAPEVDRWTLVFNDLCRQAVTSGKLVLRSSGIQCRDFITLHDVARSVLHMLKIPGDKVGNGLFNLGGECSLRIIDVAERVVSRCEAVLGFCPPIIRPEPGLNEICEGLEYRIDKLKQTGFYLEGNIDQEIDETLILCRKAFGGQ